METSRTTRACGPDNPPPLVTVLAGIDVGTPAVKGLAIDPEGNILARAEEAIRGAADALESAEADIVFEAGVFAVVGTDRRIGLLDVADRARAAGAPLDTYHAWTREAMTFPNGTHIAEVEVDPDTGRVTLERLTAVDDYGVLVNPTVAAGQAGSEDKNPAERQARAAKRRTNRGSLPTSASNAWRT